jgi:5-methylcytosine-specific restriction enzyme B
MARAPWTSDELYEVAARWVDECLRRDGSLFTPGATIWTRGAVEEVAPRLLDIDTRKLDFITKLRDQLDGVSDEGLQFTSELLYVHSLPIVNTGPDAKRTLIEAPLGWMAAAVSIPDDLITPLTGGVANFGAGLAQRDRYMRYFVQFVQAWKAQDRAENNRLLADPSSFREFLHNLGGPALMQREAILHLVDPESFEYALAPADKAKIAKTFAALPSLASARNEDEALAKVREEVEAVIGRPVNLYAPWFTRIWRDAESEGWSTALRVGQQLLGEPDFDAKERDYKLVVAERMQLARQAVESNEPDWPATLRAAFQPPNNLTHWRYVHGPFLRWCDEDPDAARRFLLGLWNAEPSSSDEFGEALSALPQEVLGSPAARLTLASVLLFAVDATQYPPYRATAVANFGALVGGESEDVPVELVEDMYTASQLAALLRVDGRRIRDFLRAEYPRAEGEKGEGWQLTAEQAAAVVERFSEPDSSDPGERYLAFLALLDELRVRMKARGVDLRDRMDAQGLMWWLATGAPPDSWSDADKSGFERFQQGRPREKIALVQPEHGGKALIPTPPAALAADLHVSERWLSQVVDLLNEKGQVIFYGPPGTGKTYVAQELGKHVEEAGGTWRLVQFHPAYGYEDFFEGYRPLQQEEGGALAFRLRHGPLREIVDRARASPNEPHLLVIDEINRGNLPKIFGELYFLLEYRDRAVRLQYSPEDEFSLPENLYFIGTMNTADRSIALVDSALRRRFYFVPFLPGDPPIRDVLVGWLNSKGYDDEPARLLEELNAALADRGASGDEFAIGPSYFITKDGEPDVERVWSHAIMPLLEERFYGGLTREQIESEFGLRAIRARLEREAEPEPETEVQATEE